MPIEEIEYIPIKEVRPKQVPILLSAWRANTEIIEDIIKRFGIKRKIVLEFGVDYGYSLAILSNFFKKAIGVDWFIGDKDSGLRTDFSQVTERNLAKYKNIEIIKSDWLSFCNNEQRRFDLIHIDISHDYQNTLDCGLWAVKHSDMVLFHDTESFPTVKKAVKEICYQSGFNFYNYKKEFGLGIITNKKL